MIRKYLIPVASVIGLALAIFVVMQGSKPIPAAAPVTQPAPAPYQSYVAGAGLVEAATENIAIGTGVGGTVTDVFVKVGDRVKLGDPLFRIRDKTLRAELVMQKAAVESAKAKAAEAKASLGDAQNQLAMYESVPDKRAIVAEELTRRRFAVESATARLQQSQADFEVAKAQVEVTEAELDRHTIKAPVDGTILQVKIHPGEYAMAGVPQTPLMVLGDVETLHVRVDVDENDAWRLDRGAGATAYVRGNRNLSTPLKFVKVEPYVVPKRSLTGESTERVDTRVLQVLYSVPRSGLPVYVGQQMDVFIDAPPMDATTRPSSAPVAAALAGNQ
jgi:RND family efflux transporter MFP subunit